MKDKSNFLNVEIAGEGPNLVLLHGFLESNEMWNSLPLESHFRTIKIELPGHGKSILGWTQPSIQFAAEEVSKVLSKHQITDFHLIGHSLGGYVALEMLSQIKLTGKCVLLHSHFWEDDMAKKKDRERVVEIVKKNKNFFLQEAIPALFLEPKNHFAVINNLLLHAKSMSAQNIGNCSLSMKNRQNHSKTIVANLDKLCIIQGDKDKLISAEKMKEDQHKLGFSLKIISDCGHMGQHEQPAEIQDAILQFLTTYSEN